MDSRTDIRTDGQTSGQTDRRTNRRTDGRTDGQPDGRTDGRTDVAWPSIAVVRTAVGARRGGEETRPLLPGRQPELRHEGQPTPRGGRETGESDGTGRQGAAEVLPELSDGIKFEGNEHVTNSESGSPLLKLSQQCYKPQQQCYMCYLIKNKNTKRLLQTSKQLLRKEYSYLLSLSVS